MKIILPCQSTWISDLLRQSPTTSKTLATKTNQINFLWATLCQQNCILKIQPYRRTSKSFKNVQIYSLPKTETVLKRRSSQKPLLRKHKPYLQNPSNNVKCDIIPGVSNVRRVVHSRPANIPSHCILKSHSHIRQMTFKAPNPKP